MSTPLLSAAFPFPLRATEELSLYWRQRRRPVRKKQQKYAQGSDWMQTHLGLDSAWSHHSDPSPWKTPWSDCTVKATAANEMRAVCI